MSQIAIDNEKANLQAFARLCAVRPAWTAVRPAREALGLSGFTLLHAGPPFTDPCRPPAPVLASAVHCCMHEGWAQDETQARRLIADGRVRLLPAQQYGAVTPLAAVISPGTALVEVSDLDSAGERRRAWSMLGSGAGPELRFGSRNPAILQRLAWRDGPLAAGLAAALQAGPIDLLGPALLGLTDGDDLHANTGAATAALCDVLIPLLRGEDEAAITEMLNGTPAFFLTLWMAACHLMLDAAADNGRDAASTLVVALAANGQDVGIRLAGRPAQWFTAPAHPPAGPRLNPQLQADALAVIGDSGVIDALGFGGQALTFAPDILAALLPWMPAGWRDVPERLSGVHPAFAPVGLRVGLDAAAVGRRDIAPVTAIGMIDADAQHGLLGRGVYLAPAELFARASETVLRSHAQT
jgi:hypothetical protein